jgi:RNA recognition motif-containing protein
METRDGGLKRITIFAQGKKWQEKHGRFPEKPFLSWIVITNERKKMNTKIYVGNIPSQTTEPDLKTLFSQAGDVISVKILKDQQTGQSRGFAFVEMSTRKEARKAVSMLNRRSFMDKELLVKEARVRREFRGRRW